MTDKEKFYRLALNVLNYEPKEVICYDGKLTVINIYLGKPEDYHLQFLLPEKELWLYLTFNENLLLTETDQMDLEKIIEIIKEKEINDLLEGIE